MVAMNPFLKTVIECEAIILIPLLLSIIAWIITGDVTLVVLGSTFAFLLTLFNIYYYRKYRMEDFE